MKPETQAERFRRIGKDMIEHAVLKAPAKNPGFEFSVSTKEGDPLFCEFSVSFSGPRYGGRWFSAARMSLAKASSISDEVVAYNLQVLMDTALEDAQKDLEGMRKDLEGMRKGLR